MASEFIGEFYETFREELMHIFLKFLQKMQREEHFQTHSMRPQSPGYQNQQRQQKRKLWANITDKHRCENPQQNSIKQNSTAH